MIRLFVTGTDTGVGKTHVATALIRALVRRGLRVAALKPAETGCATLAGDLVPADAQALLMATAHAWPLDHVCPNRYALPVAPAVAARREGRPFSRERVLAAVDFFEMNGAEVLVVEGAGGLLVPFAEDLTGADLARLFDARILIVARSALGTINHSLLTLLEGRRRGLDVRGVVLNRTTAHTDPSEADNAAEIQRLGSVPVFGPLPHEESKSEGPALPDLLFTALLAA